MDGVRNNSIDGLMAWAPHTYEGWEQEINNNPTLENFQAYLSWADRTGNPIHQDIVKAVVLAASDQGEEPIQVYRALEKTDLVNDPDVINAVLEAGQKEDIAVVLDIVKPHSIKEFIHERIKNGVLLLSDIVQIRDNDGTPLIDNEDIVLSAVEHRGMQIMHAGKHKFKVNIAIATLTNDPDAYSLLPKEVIKKPVFQREVVKLVHEKYRDNETLFSLLTQDGIDVYAIPAEEGKQPVRSNSLPNTPKRDESKLAALERADSQLLVRERKDSSGSITSQDSYGVDEGDEGDYSSEFSDDEPVQGAHYAIANPSEEAWEKHLKENPEDVESYFAWVLDNKGTVKRAIVLAIAKNHPEHLACFKDSQEVNDIEIIGHAIRGKSSDTQKLVLQLVSKFHIEVIALALIKDGTIKDSTVLVDLQDHLDGFILSNVAIQNALEAAKKPPVAGDGGEPRVAALDTKAKRLAEMKAIQDDIKKSEAEVAAKRAELAAERRAQEAKMQRDIRESARQSAQRMVELQGAEQKRLQDLEQVMADAQAQADLDRAMVERELEEAERSLGWMVFLSRCCAGFIELITSCFRRG